jgi:quinol monooxygenase YgiN
MTRKQVLALGGSTLALALGPLARTQAAQQPYVRLAELEIDPAQLGAFKAAIMEGMATAVRVEPGCLMLHAVSLKDRPHQVRVFEVYVDEAAYLKHRETPHFQKFLETTKDMVRSRKLVDAVPIQLNAKRG